MPIVDWHKAAEEVGFYATTGWSVDDVRELAPNVPRARLKDFLIDNQSRIVDAMVGAGWVAIETCLSMEDLI